MAMYIYFILVLFIGRIHELNDQLHSLTLNSTLRMALKSNMQYVHNRIIDSDASVSSTSTLSIRNFHIKGLNRLGAHIAGALLNHLT